MKVPYVIHAFLVGAAALFRRKHRANMCGHITAQKGFMHDGKSTNIMEMPLAVNGHPDYCLECIGKMSIRCAWCGEPITIGSPITLYTPKKEFKIPDYAVMYGEDKQKALIGCLRWGCADTGADLAGYWIPPGVVKRVSSPFEIAMQTGKMVMVGGTRNYPASMSLHDTN